MRYYLILILFIFLGCAAQLKPRGGPIDDSGPKLVKVSHPNLSNISNSKDKIILYFDEFIEPLSVVNAIEIMNIDDFEYMVRGKKIIIQPNNRWPDFKIIKINISRKISDFQDNIMDKPIQFIFSKSADIINNQITGQIINSNLDLFEVGVYQIANANYVLIDKAETDDDGLFSFEYLDDGKYILAAVRSNIDSLINDITIKKYGFISQDYLSLNSDDSIYVSIQVGAPLEKLSIKSFTQINNNFGKLLLSNGEQKKWIIPSDNLPGDSIDITIQLKNRIEKYFPPTFKATLNNIIDTIPPKIDSYDCIYNICKVSFDEPINKNSKIPTAYYILDSINYQLDYNFIDPFTMELILDSSNHAYIENVHDIFSNQLIDTLFIKKNSNIYIEDINVGGNIYGSIDYQGQFPIMVKAESSDLENIYYYYIDSENKFSFLNVNPGLYNFSAYEIMNDYDSTQYYPGSWSPFKRAAKFGFYNQTIEVRNHWDIQDMVILIK